jgi:hypothetical protein
MDVRQAFLEASTEPSMSLDSGRGSFGGRSGVRYVLQAVGGGVHNREWFEPPHYPSGYMYGVGIIPSPAPPADPLYCELAGDVSTGLCTSLGR